MKYIACVMAFLVFSSLFIDLCINETEKDACTDTEHLGDTGDEDSELCGPFCLCAGCTLSVIIPQSGFALVSRSYTSYLSPLSQGAPVEITLPFWQPPKLA